MKIIHITLQTEEDFSKSIKSVLKSLANEIIDVKYSSCFRDGNEFYSALILYK